MKKASNRYLALLMALVMCFSLVPSRAYAEDMDSVPEKIAEPIEEDVITDNETVDIIPMPEPEEDCEEPEEAEAFDPSDTLRTVYLAFTADVHNKKSDEAASRLNNWLIGVSAYLGSGFDDMCICGDIGAANSSESQFWSYTQSVIDTVRNSDRVGGKGIYICGNHEWNPGNYGTTANATRQYYSDTGTFTQTDNYLIYSFGPSSGGSNQFTTTNITALGTFLSTAPTDVPIFILSHFPLHDCKDRTIVNKDAVIRTLNQYAQEREIVFLWGHNHSDNDSHYDNIYTNDIDGTAIGFIYAAAGCMSDEEYSVGSAAVKGKGLVVGIVNGRISSMAYYDKNSQPLGTSSPSPTPTSEPEAIASGKCGINLTWKLDYSGTLTISGTGAMTDYLSDYSGGRLITTAPWGEYYSSIIHVEIERGVTSVGSHAFYNCVNIVGAEIADTVVSIGNNAFFDCSLISGAELPGSLTDIGQQAFIGSGITSIDIPASVTNIGTAAFARCGSLTEISVAAANTRFSSSGGVLYNKNRTELLQFPAGLSGRQAIPSGVSTVGESSFSGCRTLTGIEIPVTVTLIAAGAFRDCAKLTKVYYPGSKADWAEITIESNNGSLTNASIVYDYKYYHTVTYDANGGENAPEAQQKEEGRVLILSSAVPTRFGYSFLGWAASEDAEKAEYLPGSVYTKDKDVTLYAVWKEIPVKKLNVTPTNTSLYIGDKLTVSAEVTPEDAPKAVVWTSSNTNVAVVDDKGEVTALAKGSAIITAASASDGKKTAKCTVKVVQPVTDLSLTAPQSAVIAGKNVQLKAALYPSNAGVKTVEWSFEANEELVPYISLINGKLSINKNIPAEYTGTITVTATAIGSSKPISRSLSIELTAPVSSMTMYADGKAVSDKDKGTLWLGENETVQLSAEILPAEACRIVTWKSGSAKVASVDESGLVTALGKGSTVITMTSCDGTKKTVKYTVFVKTPAQEVTVTANKQTMTKGASLTPKATVLPQTANDKTVRWELVTPTDMVTINEKSGKLTVSKDWDGEPAQVTVRAYAKGTSRTDVFGEMTIDIVNK